MNGPGQYAGIAPWRQTAWDLRAAGNFIGGGGGSGLLMLAALLNAPALLAAGLLLTAAGLFSVFLEIGRPLRALNVLRGARTSWMTREAMLAGVIFPLGLAAFLWPLLMPWLGPLAAAYLFCQLSMLRATKGVPAWREPLVGPLIVATAVAEGTGLALLILPAVPWWLPGLLLAALAARAVLWLLCHRRYQGGGLPRQGLAPLGRFLLPFLLAGHALPALLIFVPGGLWPAGLAAAAGGWAMKMFLVTRIAFNQGFAIQATPSRGRGPTGPGARPGW